MDRRKSIALITATSPFLLLTGKTENVVNTSSLMWLNNFSIRWNNSRTYCFEVVNSMPETEFNYSPDPEIMSFSELFVHVGSGLDGYASVLMGGAFEEKPHLTEKQMVLEYLDQSFDKFSQALDNINLDHLYDVKHAKSDEKPWNEFSIFDIITLGYNHSIHHIAQATVYLRLRNIKPPRYRF